MHRFALAFLATFALGTTPFVQADEFDWYTNPILEKVPQSKNAIKVKQLTPELLVEHSSVLKNISGSLVVVKTNEGQWSKLIVNPAKQKINADKSAPILVVDRFVTYKEGEERAIHVKGENVRLFADFQLSLDIGQVVPVEVGGDLKFVVTKDGTHVEPVGKAEIYLVTKPFPGAKPDASAPVMIGEKFAPQFYNGIYHLYDDGRRSGYLHLTVGDNRAVTGHFFSDKDGKKYEVTGKVDDPHHKIQFKIIFPRAFQTFHGWMFTGDGKAFAGWAKMENQESGFYALRLEGKTAKVEKK